MVYETTITIEQIKSILDEALFLNGRTKLWRNQTRLFGDVPELDAMTVVTVLLAIENKFDVFIGVDDFNSEVFETVESFRNYICQKQLETNYLSFVVKK